jgi:fatty acid desaturase
MNDMSAIEAIRTDLDRAEGSRFPRRASANEYAQLKQIIRQRSLLDKQPRYYTYKILLTVGLLAIGIVFFLVVSAFWLRLVDAVFLAFVFGQIGFLGHDAGHRQIFNATGKNDIMGLFLGDLLIGMSFSWWVGKHNQHHSHPNEMDMDPDISIPIICFSQDDALSRRHVERFVTKYQAFFFFPLLMLVGIDMQRSGITFLLKKQGKHRLPELAMMALHYLLYFGMVFACLPLWQGILFLLVNQMLFGLYLGSTFAPNHKGMPILEQSSRLDFLRRQVVTARNVHAHPFNDFWYGGLNYQIEHHLFPSMPRNNLKEAQRVIKAFCQEHEVSYYETSAPRSYQEILSFLHGIGAPLRQKAHDRPDPGLLSEPYRRQS